MLDANSHKQEVDFSDNDILEVVLRLAVLKLDVQAVLYSHLHLQRVVDVRQALHEANAERQLLDDSPAVPSRDGNAKHISQAHVASGLAFVLHVAALEFEREFDVAADVSRRFEFSAEREEVVVVPSVKEQLHLSEQFDAYSLVFDFFV